MIVAQTSCLRKVLVVLLILTCLTGFAHLAYTITTRGVAALRWQRDHPGKSKGSKSKIKAAPKPAPDFSAGNCLAWRNTAQCKSDGPFEHDRSCKDTIPNGQSGYCQCSNYTVAHSTCKHEPLVCKEACDSARGGCVGWVTEAAYRPHSCKRLHSKHTKEAMDCQTWVPEYLSGYCLCADGQRVPEHGFACGHLPLMCSSICESNNRTQQVSKFRNVPDPTLPKGVVRTRRRRFDIFNY